MRHNDRRGLMQLDLDRAQHLEWMRTALERDFQTSSEILATRGDRLALARVRSVESDELVGPSEHEFLGMIEVNERGEAVAGVLFDPDDLDAAYEELDARFAAGEALGFRSTATFRVFQDAIATRDWARLRSGFATDFAIEDHRSLGTMHRLSRDGWVASVRSLLELRPDTVLRADHVLAFDDRSVLLVGGWIGSREEGTFEIPSVVVGELGPDGFRRWHVFDLEQLDAARACREALALDAPGDPLPALIRP
jgi:hypothetical protein